MFLLREERLCGWCDRTFTIVRRPGRPRIYCNPTCRQRAYERRRGLGVLPPPDRIAAMPGGPLANLRTTMPKAYERGRLKIHTGKTHAMRPAGIAELGDRRLTLCGVLARPLSRPFYPPEDGLCRTCVRILDLRPPARVLRPSADLAAVRSLLDQAAVEFSRSQQSRSPKKSASQILLDLLVAV